MTKWGERENPDGVLQKVEEKLRLSRILNRVENQSSLGKFVLLGVIETYSLVLKLRKIC